VKTNSYRLTTLANVLFTLILLIGSSFFLMDLWIKSVFALTEGPSVITTVPSNGDKNISLTRPIYITFDREINPSTISPETITVTDSQLERVQPRSVHYDSANKTAVFIPLTSLEQDETYQVKVRGVLDTNQFPMLQAEYIFTFQTTVSGTTPVPLVESTIPGISEKEVGIKRVISVRFNHDMDPLTITNTTFLLKDASQQPVSAKSIEYDPISRIAAFVPVNPLSSNSTYTVTLTSEIKDKTGIPFNEYYTWSFTTGEADYFNPHGNYTDNTMACSYCHSTHTAQSDELLNQTTQTALCFTCHDGTGSNYNIKANYYEPDASIQTFHPIMDTGNLELKQLLQCSDCHNPHGDKDQDGNIYPKLLRASDGKNTSYSGNEFCLICHGGTDQQFTPTFYNDTAGNHVNPNAAHYDKTKFSLLPASGTEVTCSVCHTSHSGRFNSLTNDLEENLCLNCHSDTTNSKHGRNILEEFYGNEENKTISWHDLTSSDGTNVECSSCHGPHTVGAVSLEEGLAQGLPYSDLVDPSNTKKSFTMVAGSEGATMGDMTDFCLVCHDGSPPIAERSSISVVPYTIQFPDENFTYNSGWDKSNFRNSIHSLNGVGCEDCHESHGSEYPRLLKNNEDTLTDNGMCLQCHTTVGSEFKLNSQHPTLTISGRHSDTESSADKFDPNKRHAECIDCHDPHTQSSYKQEDALCLTCHDSYSTSSSSTTQSKFSNAENENLHLYENHLGESCIQCHKPKPHGSEYAGLLYTSIDNNKISQIITDANNGFSGHWTKSSCTTNCHTSVPEGQNSGTTSVLDPLSPDTSTGTTSDTSSGTSTDTGTATTTDTSTGITTDTGTGATTDTVTETTSTP
jgi:predicted CXXCH cytochrome family protein